MRWKAIYSNCKKEKESKQNDKKVHKKETNLYRLKRTDIFPEEGKIQKVLENLENLERNYIFKNP